MGAARPHGPTFRAGLLMHLSFGVTLLAVAVVAGPPVAWLMGQGPVAAVLALIAVAGRAGVGYANGRLLWRAAARPSLVLATTISAGLTGYALVFLPLTIVGGGSPTAMATPGLPAGSGIVVDSVVMGLATASGTLIAAGAKRRIRRRIVDPAKLPLVRDVTESFAEHRARARLNV